MKNFKVITTNPIPFKTWKAEEAMRVGISKVALESRMARGSHPLPNIMKVNKRVIYVIRLWSQDQPYPIGF